jgi:hypothetical protein
VVAVAEEANITSGVGISMNKILITTITVFLAVSCAKNSAYYQEPPTPEPTEAGKICAEISDKLGDSVESVKSLLGTPAKIISEQVKNPYDKSQTDNIVSLEYTGAKVVIYEMPGQQKSFLMLATFSPSFHFESIDYLFTSTEQQIKELLEKSDNLGNETYRCYYESEDTISLSYEGEFLKSITLNAWID